MVIVILLIPSDISALAWATLYYLILPTAAILQLAFWAPLFVRRAAPLSETPGPFWARYSAYWFWRRFPSGEAEELLAEVNRKYGSLARIGPCSVIIDDSKAARRIFGKGLPNPWSDSPMINPEPPGLAIKCNVQNFEELWKDFDRKICGQIPSLAQDVMTHFSIGHSVDELQIGKNVDRRNTTVDHFRTIYDELALLTRYLAGVLNKTKVVSPSVEQGSGMKNAPKVIERHISHSAAPRCTPKNQVERSLIGRYVLRELLMKDALVNGAKVITPDENSTIAAVRSVLLAITSAKRVADKVRDEIKQYSHSHIVVSELVPARGVAQLPYLQACVKECLRMYPPLSRLRGWVVPFEGDWIDGYRVSGGTSVWLNLTVMYRRSGFGDDPESFRPERWLLLNDEQCMQEMMRMLHFEIVDELL